MLEIMLEKQQGNFQIRAGISAPGNGITALFGQSGSGKTSVINMIAGLSRPDAGRITINGTCVFNRSQGIDIRPEKRRFGYVFQDSRLFPHLSVRSNLEYGMKRIPRADRYVTFDAVIELLGIGHLLNRRPVTLSGGEKQRAAMGRALLTSPRLLLMDEPLASLDGARKQEVLPFISRLSGELSIPILYVTHSVDEITSLADYLVLMSKGKSVVSGPLEEVTAREDFQYLAGELDTGMVLLARIKNHDPVLGLSWVESSEGVLRVPLLDVPIGETVRVRIHPRNWDYPYTRY